MIGLFILLSAHIAASLSHRNVHAQFSPFLQGSDYQVRIKDFNTGIGGYVASTEWTGLIRINADRYGFVSVQLHQKLF